MEFHNVDCKKCGKEIDRIKPYWALVINKEKLVGKKVSISLSEELETFCSDECLPKKYRLIK